MGSADQFRLGSWNAICDRCGFKFKARALRLEWTGLRVCKECWDPYPPQLRVKAKIDDQTKPWTRPDENSLDTYGKTAAQVGASYSFTGTHPKSLYDYTAIVGLAILGKAILGKGK